jgi:hypothetical protein
MKENILTEIKNIILKRIKEIIINKRKEEMKKTGGILVLTNIHNNIKNKDKLIKNQHLDITTTKPIQNKNQNSNSCKLNLKLPLLSPTNSQILTLPTLSNLSKFKVSPNKNLLTEINNTPQFNRTKFILDSSRIYNKKHSL